MLIKHLCQPNNLSIQQIFWQFKILSQMVALVKSPLGYWAKIKGDTKGCYLNNITAVDSGE